MNPMPADAKLVFKGILFEVWQWEQKMFDGSVKTFERLRRQNTALVIATVGEKILVLDEQQPNTAMFPGLPGGRCDLDEDSLTAAKRELLEETGYVSDDWTLWQEKNPVGKMEWTIYTYVARDCVFNQPSQLDAGEKIETRLIDFEEFLMLSDNPLFYEKELVEYLLRARLDPKKKEEFHKLLFPK
ncbi:MAG: NUDIX hydrolase [Candidatus Liptonbacteria bacterium]|nr:NUDIX hydrolase [Candidatus Liptonbacteria bacterium]